ncbi:hypothetical protein TELCIR_06124 [Teladorsagia circumcincta]|uniref:Uncharacterized protein n=1 Tax=Teladorsagia circumcincta TaxID=45464 RepID=A0A2G9UNW5_TELCI|nr:hypothetical protein TELCIR_06124 [Teladorsagia circumcincta]
MLLFFTALFLLIVSGSSYPGGYPGRWRLPVSVKEIFIGYMRTNNPTLKWKESLSRHAYEITYTGKGGPKKPHFVLKSTMFFPTGNQLIPEQQILYALYSGFAQFWVKVSH